MVLEALCITGPRWEFSAFFKIPFLYFDKIKLKKLFIYFFTYYFLLFYSVIYFEWILRFHNGF